MHIPKDRRGNTQNILFCILSIISLSSIIAAFNVQAAVSPQSICYDNPNNFNNPTLHIWNVTPAGLVNASNWPGHAMATENGFVCYNPTADIASLNLIFSNNGANQTNDLYTTAGNTCYQNGNWTSLENCNLIQSNQAPTPNAGNDQTILIGQTVNFDASGSVDADGSITQYQWNNGLTGVNPNLTYNTAGTYNVTLTVTDNLGLSAQDTVTITVNNLPTQTDITATSICYDNNANFVNPTIYFWNANPAVIANANWPGTNMLSNNGYFCFDPEENLTSLQIILSDNGNQQSADLLVNYPNSCYKDANWVSLTSCGFSISQPENIPPVANAGNNITLEVGQTANFDATGSTDSDGSIVSYQWSNGLTGVTPNLAYNQAGNFTVTLTVTDNQGATDQQDVQVTVNAAPTYNYPNDQAIFFINNDNWPAITAHVWDVLPVDSFAENNWPGDQLTSFNGVNAWYLTLPNNVTSGNVIFSENGAMQTPDLAFNFTTGDVCYNNAVWMTLAECGIPEVQTANAGEDRTVNQNTIMALSAAASTGDIDNAVWTSPAWNGELTGANVVTPLLTQLGSFVVTMQLPNGTSASFELTVILPTHGLAERPVLIAPLNFPISGSVASGNYVYESAFPNLDSTFSSPVMVTHDGVNDLIYVVDKSGTVSVFPNDKNVTINELTVLFDISAEVRDYHEQGLLSIAFHPDFINNGYAYIYYIAGANDTESDNGVFGDAVLERITLNDTSQPTTASQRVEILRIPQPGPDHKGGMMQFHPSTGEFYMSFGDGAYGDTAIEATQPDPRTNNSSQETDNLRGSFIRIIMRDTPNTEGLYYDIPADNPFVNDANIRDEIWSYGHRNPWRWSFDSVMPYTLWETEIGQAGFEELNIIEAGNNYGWPICEGTNHRGNDGGDPNNARSCNNDLTAPIGGYSHNTGSVSVIGGFVYRGTRLPALTGNYIYGDYVSKKIWAANDTETGILVSDAFPSNIASFGTDLNGENVFISSHGAEYGGVSVIYRMVDSDVQAAVIPDKLSATGIFSDVTNQVPANGVIEYNLNSDGWFDGLQAKHFMAVPNNQQIDFDPTAETWDLPVGTVLVKQLNLPISASETKPYQTSVLFKQNTGNWAAANYYWNDTATDATLVAEPFTETVQQFHNGSVVPVEQRIRSGAECTSCHVGTGSKEPLAIGTRQLNRDFNYQGFTDNQLDVFNQINLFSNKIGSANNLLTLPNPSSLIENIDGRAKAYLETNCSHCHDGGFMDLNFDTPVANMEVMNIKRGESGQVYRMLPFNHTSSLLYTYQVDDANRMPKGSLLTNPLADQLFQDWINANNASQLALKINSTKTTSGINENMTLSAMSVFDNGFETLPNNTVSWESNNHNIINLGSNNTGTELSVNTLGTGTVTITASSNGYSGTINLTIISGPETPTFFTADANSDDSVTLTWVDNAVDETGYQLLRATNINGPFTLAKTLPVNTDTTVDNGLLANTTYYYQIIASGDSVNSIAATANVTTEATAPIDALSIISADNIQLFFGDTTQIAAIARTGDNLKGMTLSADWSSDNNDVIAISSSGKLTAGAIQGSVNITVSSQGLSASIAVTNLGLGQYLYFNKPDNWDDTRVYAWTDQAGTLTTQSDVWPGSANLAVPANEYGGNWLKVPLPLAWANNNGEINVIFNNGGADQTLDLNVNIATPSWLNNNEFLAQAPLGNGTETGSQVQVGNGEVTLSTSDNLSGKLFAQGSVVNINAQVAATGLAFSHWEGSGIAYLVDENATSTQLVLGNDLSYTLLAVFGSITDQHTVGREYYLNQGCSGCHGAEGNGIPSLLGLANNYSLAALTSYIETNMPLNNTSNCTGECASTTAALILAEAFVPPENICQADDLTDVVPQDRNYRLLSTLEYNNSVRDLLGLNQDIDVTTGRIPADIPVNGFKTNANTIFTNDYAKGYITSAETAAAMVSNIYNLTVNCNDITCFVNEFGKRAFRRPLTTAEMNSLTGVYNAEGEQALLTAILSSPSMLYRSEVGELADNGYYQLSDYEIATLLSYTYWATTPDAMLMAKAEAGQLNTAADIATTVNVMLQDSRAEKAFERFINGWLNLDKDIKTDSLSDSLKADMKQETLEFVRRIVFGGGDYNELLNADYSYMTEQLASHYGFDWPGGTGWQRVDYDPIESNGERRGILGHAGILAIQSASEKTHPVKRGLFVRKNLMCQDFPPPPVGAVLKPQADPTLTVRERFENAHLQTGCESCHQYIDGIGFGLENYNAQGLYVTTETTDDGQIKPINSLGYIGSLTSVETFLSANEAVVPYQGLNELVNLVAESDHAKACYARQWFRYSRGVHENNEDSCTLQVFGNEFKQTNNTSLLGLMVQFTQTTNFTLRK